MATNAPSCNAARAVCQRSKRAKTSPNAASSLATLRWLKLMGAARAVANEWPTVRMPASSTGQRCLDGAPTTIVEIAAANVRDRPADPERRVPDEAVGLIRGSAVRREREDPDAMPRRQLFDGLIETRARQQPVDGSCQGEQREPDG